MKENLLGLKMLENCESVEYTIDEIFRNTFVEDKLLRTNIDGTVIEFILHEGNIYERNNKNNENANAFYMELMPLIKKIYIINGVLHGYAIEYIDNRLFDDETLEKLKALSTLEFDVLCNDYQEKTKYSNVISMTFSKYNVQGYENCTIEIDYTYEIMRWLSKHKVNVETIKTKELINANRDIKIIYEDMEEW